MIRTLPLPAGRPEPVLNDNRIVTAAPGSRHSLTRLRRIVDGREQVCTQDGTWLPGPLIGAAELTEERT